jgi:hypothetical protein
MELCPLHTHIFPTFMTHSTPFLPFYYFDTSPRPITYRWRYDYITWSVRSHIYGLVVVLYLSRINATLLTSKPGLSLELPHSFSSLLSLPGPPPCLSYVLGLPSIPITFPREFPCPLRFLLTSSTFLGSESFAAGLV